MKHVFLDTNILVDLLANRQPFYKYALQLFTFAEKNKVKLFTSSHSIATTHYLLKKFISEDELRKLLLSLTDFVEVTSVDLNVIRKSLLSDHRDFEDAIQIFAAESIPRLDFIVTRNLKDFKNSAIMVLPPEEAVGQLL